MGLRNGPVIAALMALLLGAPHAVQAGAVPQGARPWPNRIVRYTFNADLLIQAGAEDGDCAKRESWAKSSKAVLICNAMDAWQVAAGVWFVFDRQTDPDSLSLREAKVTTGTLGYRQTGNLLTVRTDASEGDILHELGHVIGLMHEHQRPDRDDYLVLSAFLQDQVRNCDPLLNQCRNIRRSYVKLDSVELSTQYDPCSIMHYAADQTVSGYGEGAWRETFTLTQTGEAALTACAAQLQDLPACRHIGQRCAISAADASVVRRFYKLEKDAPIVGSTSR